MRCLPISSCECSSRTAIRTAWMGASRSSSVAASCHLSPGEDLLDDSGFGVGVVLGVFPGLGGQLTLGALVELPVCFFAAQVVAEAEHLLDLRATLGKHVQVDDGVRAVEHAMLEPVWLAHPQDVA